jgi:hypothetical protein
MEITRVPFVQRGILYDCICLLTGNRLADSGPLNRAQRPRSSSLAFPLIG